MCGVWLDIQTVYSSVPGLYQPMSPRTSMGLGMRRWLTMRWRTTTSAASTAAIRARLVADRPLEDDVARRVLVELHGARLGRGLRVDHHGQRLVVDDDGLQGIDRLGGRLGDHRRHALAGPLDAVGGQDARRVDVVLDARHAAGRPGHGQRVVGDVGAGEDGDHAGHGACRRRVDGPDVGVGVRAAQDRQVGHARHLDVVEVAALAGDEARVLDPLDGGAEDVGGHRARLPSQDARPAASAVPSRVVRAASRMAATMFW